MEFRKYMHVERYSTSEVENINLGECVIFPKLDGTNASIWLEDGKVMAGSRNRVLGLGKEDNAGFNEYIKRTPMFETYLKKHPNHRLFGEWLKPHSFKDYRDDTWGRFYIFDVSLEDEEHVELLPYKIYTGFLDEFGLEYIPPIAEGKNISYERLVGLLDKNTYLVKDGHGAGEGIVIKNYDFYNKYGRQIWAKIVTTEFKEKHVRAMGASRIGEGNMVEEKILEEYYTTAFIDKTYEKIKNDAGEWTSKMIPRLLNTVFHELILEETWNILKKFKNPTINFKTLNYLSAKKIKELKPEIFA